MERITYVHSWLRNTLLLIAGLMILPLQFVLPGTNSHSSATRSVSSVLSTVHKLTLGASTTCYGPGSYTTGNWVDNEAVESGCPRGVYREASVGFYVPTISLSDTNAQVGFWVGVGGDSGVTKPNVLVQVGVRMYPLYYNGKWIQYAESFWEIVNSNSQSPPLTILPQNLPLCHLHPGDYVYITVESNVNNDGWDYFYINNASAGCSNYCQLDTTGHRGNMGDCGNIKGITSYNSDSASAECVGEQVYDSYFNPIDLAEWNPNGGVNGKHNLEFDSCEANNQYITPSSPHAYSNIVDLNNNHQLTNIGPLDLYGDFTITWLQGN